MKESLGKAEVSNEEIESFISEGAKKSVGQAMASCVRAAKRLPENAKQDALKACRTNSAREALQNSLGEDLSAGEVQRYLEDGAIEKTRMAAPKITRDLCL